MDAGPITIPGYRVLRAAGRGGMGVVYEAVRHDGERVAIKVIAPEHRESDEFATRFAREARAALELSHPHIVRLVESGVTDDGHPFLAFAYIDGIDLDKRLREHGRLSPAETARVVSQIAQALDAAHALGFVHRDVKPANVLLNRRGAAFLNDFGLTRPVTGTRFTVSGMWLGTVDYAAPEQIQGQPVDARTDIYALAAMAHHLLGGVVPFPRDSDMAKLWAHVNDARPKLPTELAHREVLDRVIARGMAQDANARHHSAGDFAQALVAATQGRSIQLDDRTVATGAAAPSQAATIALATPSGGPTAPAPTVRMATVRRRWKTVVAAVAGTATAGIVAVALILTNGPESPSGAALAARTGPSTPTPEPTTIATATVAPTSTPSPTPTATPRKRSRPNASPKRGDDLPLGLDIESNVPTQVGSWSPYDDATVGAAQKAFGIDYQVESDSDNNACTLGWPALGITVTFVNFGGGDACGVDEGLAQTIRIDGTVSDRWRTLSGLRPGMPESRIPKLYRKARKTDGGDWWLVTAKSMIGGGSYYAPIAATVNERGRVDGFEIWVGAGGD